MKKNFLMIALLTVVFLGLGNVYAQELSPQENLCRNQTFVGNCSSDYRFSMFTKNDSCKKTCTPGHLMGDGYTEEEMACWDNCDIEFGTKELEKQCNDTYDKCMAGSSTGPSPDAGGSTNNVTSTCPNGYDLSDDGESCCNDDECIQSTYNCPSGYDPSEDGESCCGGDPEECIPISATYGSTDSKEGQTCTTNEDCGPGGMCVDSQENPGQKTCIINTEGNLGINMNSGCLINGQCSYNIYKTLGIRKSDQNPKVSTFVQDIVLGVTMFLGTVISLILIISGVLYILAGIQGNSSKADMAKKGIINSLLGLVLVTGSYALVRLIQFVATAGGG